MITVGFVNALFFNETLFSLCTLLSHIIVCLCCLSEFFLDNFVIRIHGEFPLMYSSIINMKSHYLESHISCSHEPDCEL